MVNSHIRNMKTKPKEFINSQYIWSGFKEKILPELTDKKSTLKLEEHELGVPMYDTEITKKYGDISISVDIFASVLQNILKDKEKWYLFHVKTSKGVVAVDVRWDGDGWRLRAFGLGCGGPWSGGCSFFAPATRNLDTKSLDTSETLTFKNFLSDIRKVIEKYE